VASELIALLRPQPAILLVAVVADLLIGDPVYPFHPIRLIGKLLTALESMLRAAGADGYAGGITLFVLLARSPRWQGDCNRRWRCRTWSHHGMDRLMPSSPHRFLACDRPSRLARRQALSGDTLDVARERIQALVGRDVDRMDAAASAAPPRSSLSENLTDGFTSPLAWYAIGGLPGLVIFKVVSTMDSMVGYKTPRYLRFGWCGARLDDVMNYPTARATWLVIAVTAAILPSCSGLKAFRVGLRQHAILLGPNSGWSEAATAGGIQRRLVGPIWMNGRLVTDVWIGDPRDPPAQARADVMRGLSLVTASGLAATGVALFGLILVR
jgi:adenosylcobinamide-phosphate synthase